MELETAVFAKHPRWYLGGILDGMIEPGRTSYCCPTHGMFTRDSGPLELASFVPDIAGCTRRVALTCPMGPNETTRPCNLSSPRVSPKTGEGPDYGVGDAPVVKIDLDKLERKARDAESDEWQWRPANSDILEGRHQGQVVLAGEDLMCSVSDRAHIAAASPPVVLALIARIRELEGVLREGVLILEGRDSRGETQEDRHSVGQGDPRAARALRGLLEKGAVLP